MLRVLTFGHQAVGQLSWTVDEDSEIVAAHSTGTAAHFLISSDKNLTAGAITAPAASAMIPNVLVCLSPTKTAEIPVPIPIDKGSVVYSAGSAAGSSFLTIRSAE